MTTHAQITTNQQNAQHSTGPRSVEGKSVSRFNALKHGIGADSLILPGEDQDQLTALTAGYFSDCRPQGQRQSMLVETMIRADWHVRRYDRIEAQVVALLVDPSLPAGQSVARIYAEPAGKNNPLPYLFRRRAAAQRDWFRANQEFERLQKEARENPQSTEPDPGPEDLPATPPAPEPQLSTASIGFVLSEPAATPPVTANRPDSMPK